MTFEDLPDSIRELPLDTAVLRADLVDLCLGLGDRAADSMLLGLCDEHRRMVKPIVIEEVDWRRDRERREGNLARLAEAAEQLAGVGQGSGASFRR